jgi:hypothetical protein
MTRKIVLFDLPNELPAGAELIPLVNASLDAADGWLYVPYADVPINIGAARGIQRLNKEVAVDLVNRFHSWKGRLQRLFKGLPFYIGHPDSQAFAHLPNDGRSYGWIKDLTVFDAGLGVKVDWTAAGQELINDAAFHWWSPFFKGARVGTENSVAVYQPMLLQSAGFTNTPNWPGADLPNADMIADGTTPSGEPQPQEESSMTLLERIKALFARDDINCEDDVVGAVQTLINAVKKLRESVDARWDLEDMARAALPNDAGDLVVIGGYVEHAAGQLTELVNAASAHAALAADFEAHKTQAAAELAAALDQVQQERKARVIELVNQAVADGRILPAHIEQRTAAIVDAENFDAALEDLANATPAIKTQARVKDLGSRSSDRRGRQEKILELVNARMGEAGEDYATAFSAIRKMEEHAVLFADEPA